jgi:hypothetical protein
MCLQGEIKKGESKRTNEFLVACKCRYVSVGWGREKIFFPGGEGWEKNMTFLSK